MKETLKKWWNPLCWFRKGSRVDENGQSDTTVLEQILPEGDNSPIIVLDEADSQIDADNETISTISEDDSQAKVEQMSDIDFIEVEEHSSKKDNEIKEVQDEVGVSSPTSVDPDKLVSLTIDSIRYFDQLLSQMPTDDLKTILDEVSRNLIDNLVMAGCTPIKEEPGTFNMARHQVVPFQMVTDGTPYQSIKRSGIEYKGEVKLLAIVEL